MGILFITLASILFGTVPSVQSVLLDSGMSAGLISLETMVVALLLSLAAGILRGESFRVTGRQLAVLALAGGIGRGMTEICLVTAYTMIPSGVATMVHFFFPTLVSLAMVFIFREKWTKGSAAAILLSLAGLAGIADGARGGSLLGIAVAGISSVSFAFYYILTEKSDLKDLPPMVMIFYVHLFAVAANTVFVCVRGEWRPAETFFQAGTLVACGLMGVLGYLFLNRGIPMIGAGVASFINMLEPIVSVMMSIWVFHARLTWNTCIGCMLIVCAMFVRAAEKKPSFEDTSAPKCLS